jgi:hypothetical protein
MPRRKPFKALHLHVLTIAVAIQGVTPDPSDLASIRGLEIIALMMTDSAPQADDQEPLDGVCASVSQKSELPARASKKTIQFVGVTSGVAHTSSIEAASTRQIPPLHFLSSAEFLIQSSCRLNC